MSAELIQADSENTVGLPRLVLEMQARLGPTATPEQVAAELHTMGVETTVEDVRMVWVEGDSSCGCDPATRWQ